MIAADYARSHEWGCSAEGKAAMEKMVPAHLHGRINIDPWCRTRVPTVVHALPLHAAARPRRCEAPEHAMLDLFGIAEDVYGSIDRYLDSIGVDAALRARCADALTVSSQGERDVDADDAPRPARS